MSPSDPSLPRLKVFSSSWMPSVALKFSHSDLDFSYRRQLMTWRSTPA